MTATSHDVQHAVEQLAGLKLHNGAGPSTSGGSRSGGGGTSAISTAGHTVNWDEVTALAQTCADSLKSEQARTDLGSGSLTETCAACLEATASEQRTPSVLAAQTQLCRIVGNLVLDHPPNRIACLKAEIPQRTLQVLSTLHTGDHSSYELAWLQAIKACTGALLNLSIDTPQVASLLYSLQALRILGKNLLVYQIGSWGSNADSPSSLVRALTAEWSINLIKELLGQEGSSITSVALPLARTITSLSLLESSSSPGFTQANSGDSDQAYTLVSADLSILSTAAELLESRIYTEESIQEDIALDKTEMLRILASIVESGELLQAWRPVIQADKADDDDSLEAEKTFSHFKADIARILIGVCSNDKVMKEAFQQGSSLQWLVPTCIRWLQSSRPDLVITGSTVLANLARSDDVCTTLVQDYNLAATTADILQAYTANENVSTSGQPGEAVQVLHGVVGLVKNLSIAGANKQTLCDSGVIEPCLSLLKDSYDMVVPLQNAAVGVLKHLCAGNISSSLKVILPPTVPGASAVDTLQPSGTSDGHTPSTPIDGILSLISRTNDVRLQCEATRLLVNIVRSLYSSRSITSPVTPSALGGLEMGLAKAKARSIIESNEGVVEAISEIVRTGEKYPMLVNEGIVALTLLSTTESGARFALKALTTRNTSVPQLEELQEAPGTSLSAAANASQSNGYHRDRSVSRAVSLNPKNAPARPIDVLVRWLNSYAIAAQDMPAELAGNALSLIEGVSRLPGSEQVLPVVEIRKCLEGVLRRESSGPTEQVLRDAAQRNLDRLASA